MAALEEAKSSSGSGAASLEMERTSLMTARGRIRDLEVNIKREVVSADSLVSDRNTRLFLDLILSLAPYIGPCQRGGSPPRGAGEHGHLAQREAEHR